MSQFLWFIPYIHVRTSAENHGGSTLIWGIAFFLYCQNKALKEKYYALVGLFLGIAFIFRIQIGVSLFALLVWAIIHKIKPQKLIFMTAGGIMAFLLALASNYWGYGEWTVSFYNYILDLITHNRANSFGVSPFWSYVTLLLNRGIPVVSFPMMIAQLYYWYKNPLSILSWLSFPFFIAHCFIGHKELRFLFPLILLSPYIFTLSLDQYDMKVRPWMVKMFNAVNVLFLIIVCTRSANRAIPFYKYLYKNNAISHHINTLGGDPQRLVSLFPHFYLKINRDFSNSEKSNWHFTNKGEQKALFKNCDLEYSTYPEWIFKLPVKHLLKKSRVWSLFNCSKLSKNEGVR